MKSRINFEIPNDQPDTVRWVITIDMSCQQFLNIATSVYQYAQQLVGGFLNKTTGSLENKQE